MRLFFSILILCLLCSAAACSKKVIRSEPVDTANRSSVGSDPSPLSESDLNESPLPPSGDSTLSSYDSSQSTADATSSTNYSPYDEPGYYTYQVGLFATEAEAQTLGQRLTDNGFLVDVEHDQQTAMYRVVAGHSGTDSDIRAKLAGLGVTSPTPRPFSGLTERTDTYSTSTVSTSSMTFFQVGSFSKPENAQTMRASLEQQGFTTFLEPVTVSGMTQNRVIAGMQGDEETVRQKLGAAGIYTPVRHTGAVPGYVQEAESAQTPAAATTYQPPATGGLTYQVGSFSKRDNAQGLSDLLASGGFATSIETVNVGGSWVYRVLATGSGSESDIRSRLAAYGVHDPMLRSDLSSQSTSSTATTPQYQPQTQTQTQQTPASAIATPPPASGEVMLFQAAAFSRLDNAKSLQQGLVAHGLDSYVDEVPSSQGGLTQYRVIVRHSGDEQAIRQKLYELGITDPVLIY